MVKKAVSVNMSLTFMGAIAALMSWVVNKSVVWATVHFFCGGFYVLYAALAHTEELDAAARHAFGP